MRQAVEDTGVEAEDILSNSRVRKVGRARAKIRGRSLLV